MKRMLGAGSWWASFYPLTNVRFGRCTFQSYLDGTRVVEDDRQRTERERVEQLFAGLRRDVTR